MSDGRGQIVSGDEKEARIMGLRMHLWTMEETVRNIEERLSKGLFTQHVVVNVAKLLAARRDPQLKACIERCEIINVDGMGVVWGARFLGYPVPERVAGVDLFFALIALAERRRYGVFLLGAREAVLEEAVRRLRKSHPALPLAGWHHGYFSGYEERVMDLIRGSGAKLLFVAMSSPQKEQFIGRWREQLGVGLAMGVGGTFDVVAGYTKRAPKWMQEAGLEWSFRLVQEPRRMAWRYLAGNMRFAGLLIKEKVGWGASVRSDNGQG